MTLLKEWTLITLALYIAQLRPVLDIKLILDYDPKGKTWDDATKQALESEHKYDAHYVKGIRAMKEAAALWGDNNRFFEKAAVKFATEFVEWQGFSQEDLEAVKKDISGRNRRGSLTEL